VSIDFMPVRRRQEALYNCATAQNRLRYNVTQNSLEATASAVTIAIDTPGGTEVLAAAAMTQDTGTDSQWYYDLDTSTVADFPLGEGYKATITYTISSVAYIDVIWIDVVRRQLVFTTTDNDLERFEHDLENWKLDGHTTWAHKLRAAEDLIRSRLRQKISQDQQVRPALVVGFDQLKMTHILWTIELIALDVGNKAARDDYREQRIEELEAALSNLNYSQGDDDDPDVTETENVSVCRSTR
jgi:hypothetical protein